MQDWNPALYLRFANERTRPAAELLARVPGLQPARSPHIVDLGCGPGNSTELLVERFVGPDNQADVLGIDNSEAMLETARKQLPQARFEAGDIASWAPVAGQPAGRPVGARRGNRSRCSTRPRRSQSRSGRSAQRAFATRPAA